MLRKIKKDGLAKTHKKSLEVVNSYCGDLDLIDVWRIKNPEQGRFTWQQKNPEIHCRLDFFFLLKVNAHLAATHEPKIAEATLVSSPPRSLPSEGFHLATTMCKTHVCHVPYAFFVNDLWSQIYAPPRTRQHTAAANQGVTKTIASFQRHPTKNSSKPPKHSIVERILVFKR